MDKHTHARLSKIMPTDNGKNQKKKEKNDIKQNDGANTVQPTATPVIWTTEEGINSASKFFLSPKEAEAKSLAETSEGYL